MSDFHPCNINAAAVQLCKDTEDSCVCAAYDKGVAAERARIIGILKRVRDEYRQDDDLESLAASGALSYALAAIQEDGDE